MKQLIYVLLCLMCSCSAKRKLTSTTRMHTEKLTELQSLRTRKQSAQSYLFSLDSSNGSNWLKVYPREVFTVNKDGFIGAADSLIWYGNSRQFSMRTQQDKQDQEQWQSEVSTSKEGVSLKAQQREVFKTGTSLWWILAAGIAIGMLLICRKLKHLLAPG
ncbi:hypothetical protein [Pedobacter xixiisoli]|uniref:Uncharacterized protein n=1 Tax=Pedobacter xixiisoli TaxID=1476464 RepID=A0A285ZZP2_9SPHI|nr:hypothetical protein [Pedobacter xixiisoli]SOD15117.1 hypothetical protein SAMN06297358_2092 [Pedobacter xixiisoli]